MFRANNPNSAQVPMEELEKKIEAVNTAMVAVRNDTEKFNQIKEKVQGEVNQLEEKKNALQQEIIPLESKKSSLNSDKEVLEKEISQKKVDLININQEVSNAKLANEEESIKLNELRESLKKREEEIKGQEALLRTYAKGLEEKEKKLDIYASRLTQYLNKEEIKI